MAEQRLIDAEALLIKLSRMIDYCKKDSKVNGLTALFQVGDAIMDCPTVEAKPVVHAHWVSKDTMEKFPYAKNHYCSNCKVDVIECGNFCTNCGAQMDEEERLK